MEMKPASTAIELSRGGLEGQRNDTDRDSLVALVDVLIESMAPADGATGRRRLLEGVAAAIGADAWSWALTRTPRPGVPGEMPVPLSTLAGGWTEAQRTVHVQAQQSPHRRVFGAPMMRAFDRDGHVTVARPELLDDAAWRGSDYYRSFCAAMGLDEFLLSARRVDAQDVSGVSFWRAAGRPAFGAAEAALVRAAMARVAWLHRDGLPAGATAPLVTLTPRERQVVQLLKAGDGYKQIAAKLGISEHTVGGYLKSIYRTFGVSSRGELQARLAAGQTAAVAPPSENTPNIRGR